MMSGRYTGILACPDCKGDIEQIERDHALLGFFCETCRFVYPVREGIPILLPRTARNYSLEYDLVQDIGTGALSHRVASLEKYVESTLALLESSRDAESWQWQDEKFWREEYQRESEAVVRKNWNDRIWQRQFLVRRLVNDTKLRGSTILDCSCGEGQNFRLLLSQYCDEDALYIGTDICLEGLKLNRLRNPHTNSVYVLCSADKLPFRRAAIDILCYFGILHHTERKTGLIPEHIELVKKGGYILIHEALVRPSLLQGVLKPKREESAHEERIIKNELLSQFRRCRGVRIIASRGTDGPVFAAAMRPLRRIMLTNKPFFSLVSDIDMLVSQLFGAAIPFFRSGEIMLLVRK